MAFSLQLRLHYKAARAAGVNFMEELCTLKHRLNFAIRPLQKRRQAIIAGGLSALCDLFLLHSLVLQLLKWLSGYYF